MQKALKKVVDYWSDYLPDVLSYFSIFLTMFACYCLFKKEYNAAYFALLYSIWILIFFFFTDYFSKNMSKRKQ